MTDSTIPDDVIESMRSIVGPRWAEQKKDFLRSLGDQNHPFRDLHRLNEYFDLGYTTGQSAAEMIEQGPFDDRGEMESPLPE